MLVLTRKRGQAVVIGDEILVKVIDVSGDYVKIGIEAPKNVSIRRQEIYESVAKENLQGAQSIQEVNERTLEELSELISGRGAISSENKK